MNLFLFPESYQKNLLCIQEVTDKILSHMKGHNYSFLPEITDKKGNFSPKKLNSLLEELLSFWAARLRDGADIDPVTGESVAEPHIRARQELYRSYLYLTMRCSLIKGAYAHVYGTIIRSFQNEHGITEYVYAHSRGDDAKERTDFAFLLKQAKYLSQSWCVMADADGHKWNELYEGYDRHFGFHLYHVLMTPLDMLESIFPPDGSTLTPEWKVAFDQLHLWTDEGTQKRFFIQHSSSGHVPLAPAEGVEETEGAEETERVEKKAQPDEKSDAEASDDELDYDEIDYDEIDEEDMDGVSGYGDGWEYSELYDDAEFMAGRLEQMQEEADRAEWLKYYAGSFECREEYLAACRSFKELFEKAGADVLWRFYEDLEEIVDLYLAKREVSPLMDTDKTLDVYSRAYDEACRQAAIYERGNKWKNM